jgi:branched-chain amino acid transport system substrate-binding protein
MQRSLSAGVLAGVAGCVVALAGCGGDDSKSDGGGSTNSTSSTKPIVIGMAVGESGPIAGYDKEPTQAVELRVKKLNAAGGIDGRSIKLIKKNTQSDPEVGTNVANELVQAGAAAIITSCDFDFGSPAAIVAQANKIPGISLCASDPKFADTKTIGDYAFSFGPGADSDGVGSAEFAYNDRKWKKAFVLKDESIEYTNTVDKYFEKAWKDLGGTIVGKDAFRGGDNVNVRSQATKMKQNASGADFIYLASWNPGAATAIRQLREAGIDTPILGTSALDGSATTEIAGKVSDLYHSTLGCYACSDNTRAGVPAYAKEFQSAAGSAPTTGYDLTGAALVDALAAAIKKTGGDTDGAKLRDALVSLGPLKTDAGTFPVATQTCHKPTAMPYDYVEIQGGKTSFVTAVAPKSIPDVGDDNPCAGPVAAGS